MERNGVCPVAGSSKPLEEACGINDTRLDESRKRDRSPAKSAAGDGDGQVTTRARSRAVAAAAVQGGNGFELFAKRGSLYDQNDNEIVLKGLSWFGFEFSTITTKNKNNTCNILNGLWELRLGPTLDSIVEQGFNLVRLPIDYVLAWDAGNSAGSIEAKGGSAETDGKTTLQVLDWVVDECAQRGILILFDMQRNDGGASKEQGNDHVPPLWYDKDWPLERGIEAWKRLLRRYKGAWNVIGADLKNEPHTPEDPKDPPPRDAVFWSSSAGDANANKRNNWRSAATEMAKAILSDADLRKYTIWVEGLPGINWGSSLEGAQSEPIEVTGTLQNKLVYSVHCYGPDVVGPSGWWADGRSITGQGGKRIEDQWDKEWGFFKDAQDVPVILGEWMGKSEQGSLDDEWTKRFVAWLRGKDATAQASPSGANRWQSNIVWSFNGNDTDTGGLVAGPATNDKNKWGNGDGKPVWRQHKLDYLRQVCPSPTKILLPKSS